MGRAPSGAWASFTLQGMLWGSVRAMRAPGHVVNGLEFVMCTGDGVTTRAT
jgi:hypothetical protein